MKDNKDYREIRLFLCFFALSFVGCVLTDLLGHNSMGYRAAIPYEDIDWIENCNCALIMSIFLTLLTHRSDKND